jgi:hypothetical protein
LVSSITPARDLQNLRILEIGQFTLFNRVYPEITAHIWTGYSRSDVVEGKYLPPGIGSAWLLWRWLRTCRFDLIVCYGWEQPAGGSHRILGRRWLRSLPMHLLRVPTRTPLVVVDMFDSATIARRNRFLMRRCLYYFKRELRLDTDPSAGYQPEYLSKLKPISIGLSEARMRTMPGPVAKTTDVFFAGDIYPGARSKGIRQLLELQTKGYTIDIPEHRLPYSEYLRHCARAWLVWSPPGRGWDCFRHYEAAAAGSVPVMICPSIRAYEPFVDGVHGFYYDGECDSLMRVVTNALRDRPRLLQMASAARAHVWAHFTHERLCAYILETCFGPLAGPDEHPRPRA